MKMNTNATSRLALIASVMASISLSGPLALAVDEKSTKNETAPGAGEVRKSETKAQEPKSEQTKATNPEVQSEVEKNAAEKRTQLLKDAQSALEDTKGALQALDQGKKEEALAALERVTGKLDLIIARDPTLALAPVGVATIVRDLYASPDTAGDAVKLAKDSLNDGKVQKARALLSGLASEADLQVSNIPLATYPVAIKAIAPLIDAGKLAEAKQALSATLSTLVIENYVTPLPKIRAQAILAEAEKLAEKSNRSAEENKQLHDNVEGARAELKLGEVLGYGTKDDYQPLYVQLDEIQKKTGDSKSGKGFFDKIKESLKNFKDHILN